MDDVGRKYMDEILTGKKLTGILKEKEATYYYEFD